MQKQESITDCLTRRDVRALSQGLFRFSPTPRQELIIRAIAFAEHPRIVINCMTRYGKTRCVAIGVCLYIILHPRHRVLLIAPKYDQTNILRNYVAELIADSQVMSLMVVGRLHGAKRLKQQLSRKRITFNNGAELTVLSAEGLGERLMGFGGDLIVLDESGLIKPEVYRLRISRMLGDSKDSVLVEIGNPLSRDNHFYEHWIDETFHHIHIGWETAVQEGRVSKEFIDEQRATLSPIEFRVLYESLFPTMAEDSLFDYDDIEACMELKFTFQNPDTTVIGCDPADKGKDETVLMCGQRENNTWIILNVYGEFKSEHTKVADRIIAWQQQYRANRLNCDYGMGAGILSMLRQKNTIKWCTVNPCHFGGKARNDRRFLNMKAEMYWYLSELVKAKAIQLPRHDKLKKQLLSMKWEKTSADKIRIIDPEDKSPDYADCLVVTLWHVQNQSYSIA